MALTGRRGQLVLLGILLVLVGAVAAGLHSRQADEPVSSPQVARPDPGGVAGFAFQDRDTDGSRDTDEVLLAGWQVSLFSTGPLALETTTTGIDGSFAFPSVANLAAGTTSVRLQFAPVMEGPAADGLPEPTALSESRTARLGQRVVLDVPSYRLCLELAACPGLKLPDLVPLLTTTDRREYPPPTATRIDTTTRPGRVLLRFASSNANLGGLLHVVASPRERDGAVPERIAVQQRIYGSGVVFVHDAGSFVYHPEHHHFHVADFETYELRTADSSRLLRTSGKVSFCLTDIQEVGRSRPEAPLPYLALDPLDCGTREQGINTGFADYYGRDLPDQWIDMTGLPSGTYTVQFRVNPQNRILESDTTNGTAKFRIEYIRPPARSTGP